ncbi:sensor histidine kinase [Streptomyces sp. P6-2-1]|uniref:sensor histidine kinase n=1 Tax=unclassified Streptomyces TaxID=2593676 RepID=UPI003D36FEE2
MSGSHEETTTATAVVPAPSGEAVPTRGSVPAGPGEAVPAEATGGSAPTGADGGSVSAWADGGVVVAAASGGAVPAAPAGKAAPGAEPGAGESGADASGPVPESRFARLERFSWRPTSLAKGHRPVQQLDSYTRATLSRYVWAFFAGWVLPDLLQHFPSGDGGDIALRSMLLLASLAVCAATRSALLDALDRYLGRTEALNTPAAWRLLALTALTAGLYLVCLGTGTVDTQALVTAVMFFVNPVYAVLALRVPVPRFLLAVVGGTALLSAAALLADSEGTPSAVLAIIVPCSALLALVICRPSGWSLARTWDIEYARQEIEKAKEKVERAKETESRLAVAEERLRFGRDLHDVLGRNLATIALKSELAVQLARRDRTEDAAAQMAEVQEIAQRSQREVREVVRGYRGIDLGAELLGARSVLEAAGIDCATAAGDIQSLAPPVQAALAWVVREAATNVLRHGDARHCSITLATSRTGTSLTVENDGAPETPSPTRGGSGLAGLRERLASVDGTLEAGPTAPGRFRLAAHVPLPPVPDAAPGGNRP